MARRLMSWAAGRLDSDDLPTTALLLFQTRCDTVGVRRARFWYRRQAGIAVFHALRRPAVTRRNEIDTASRHRLAASIPRELRLAGRRIRHAPMRAITFGGIVGIGIAAGAFMIQVRATMLSPDLGLSRSVHLVSWHTPEGRAQQTIPVSPDAPWLAEPHSAIARVVPIWPVSHAIGTEAGHLRAAGQRAPSGVLDAFGRRAIVGRDLGAEGEVVLSHRLWASHFGSDAGALGRTIEMDGEAHTVVGVAPPDFDGPLCCVPPAFWVAARAGAPPSPGLIALIDVRDEAASAAWLSSATTEIGEEVRVELTEASSAPYGGDQGVIGRTLLVLLALALVAWVGTLLSGANLVLADTLDRARELRLRRALGSHSAHTALRTLAETTWLATLAALLAIVVAAAMVALAPWLLPMIGGTSSVEVSVGRPTLAAIGLAAALASVLCSVPATLAAMVLERQSVERGPGRSRMSSVGLGLQVSLAAVTLVVTGFLVNSIRHLDGAFVGFRNGDTAVHYVRPTDEGQGLSAAAITDALRRSEPRVTVALTQRLPVYGARRDSVRFASGEAAHAAIETVTPEFFRLVGTNLLSGTEPTRADEAVVSESLARSVASTPNGAIGATLTLADTTALRVVGVIEDATWGGGEIRPTVYRGWNNEPIASAVLLVGADGAQPAVGELLRALQPLGLALQPFETLDGLLTRSRVLNVFITRLALLFGTLCTIVALGGIHAHFARWVRTRRRALAIRRALGARGAGQARTVASATLRIVVPAALLGVGLGWITGRAMQSVFAVPTPPTSLPLVIAGALVGASLLALVAPVRRASRVDPLSLLKAD